MGMSISIEYKGDGTCLVSCIVNSNESNEIVSLINGYLSYKNGVHSSQIEEIRLNREREIRNQQEEQMRQFRLFQEQQEQEREERVREEQERNRRENINIGVDNCPKVISSDICMICGKGEENERIVLYCKHQFHGKCLKEIFYEKMECPNCGYDYNF